METLCMWLLWLISSNKARLAILLVTLIWTIIFLSVEQYILAAAAFIVGLLCFVYLRLRENRDRKTRRSHFDPAQRMPGSTTGRGTSSKEVVV